MSRAAEGARERARLGVFGGTFDPIHVGHLRAAEEAAELLGLERVVFVPSAHPPHKGGRDGDPVAPAASRLAWVRLAVEGNPRFEVDALEIERGGRSYSVDTLRSIGARVAPERPVFLIGEDAFADLGTWREPEKVLALAHFAVITRPPQQRASLADGLPPALLADLVIAADGRSARHRSAGTWLRRVEITALDVSASDLRARLREGRSVRYLLPEAVRIAVLASGAYGRRGNG